MISQKKHMPKYGFIKIETLKQPNITIYSSNALKIAVKSP